MKRAILYSVVSLVLGIILLFRLELFYINISPNNTYRLTQTEQQLIDNAILNFRERVEERNFDDIKKEFAELYQDDYRNNYVVNELKENRIKYGKPLSWEFFRSAQPHKLSEHSIDSGERYYCIEYLTKAEKGEFLEDFIYIIKGNKIKLSYYSGQDYSDVMTWRVEQRNKQKLIIKQYPNEIIIPYADRYIEFRY